jgi:hypothetical protein
MSSSCYEIWFKKYVCYLQFKKDRAKIATMPVYSAVKAYRRFGVMDKLLLFRTVSLDDSELSASLYRHFYLQGNICQYAKG